MFQEGLHHIIQRLEEARARGLLGQYALIGGLAVSFWSEPRATHDLDFAVALKGGAPQSLADFLQGAYRAGEPGDRLQGVIAASSGPSEKPVPFSDRELDAIRGGAIDFHLIINAVGDSHPLAGGLKLNLTAPATGLNSFEIKPTDSDCRVCLATASTGSL